MVNLCSDVLSALGSSGKTLATAESLTGGGIGAALTSVPGASSVYKGGIISYTDQVKNQVLGVPMEILECHGAVSELVAKAMVAGVRKLLKADVAVSVTGLAGPGGDAFGHSVGTVFIGYEDQNIATVVECHFDGNRDDVRDQTVRTALELILKHL